MSHAPQAPQFSIARVLVLALPLAILLYVASRMYSGAEQERAKAALEQNMMSQLLGRQEHALKLASEFVDADGDLLADAPKDAAKIDDPEEINFSFVATSVADNEQATWRELLDAVSKSTGKKVKLVSYADVAEQKRALKSGELHIAAFSTGDVPGAVNEAGFVPLACAADADGRYHYTMKIIVPADSPIKAVDDLKPIAQGAELKKHRFTFVRPGSNSGCTAALVMLLEKHQLQPERDYNWGFSFGHENSIDGVAGKKFEAASVASDMLERRIANGDINADDVRSIFESDPYPPAAIGCVYNLKPELRDEIRQALLSFDWKGTGLEKAFGGSGAVKFAAVSYKDDWKGVRDINRTCVETLASIKNSTR